MESTGRNSDVSVAEETHTRKLAEYYKLHAAIYDWTRWSFLFGRKQLLNRLPELPQKPRILEIGCGTGAYLIHLADLFPEASLCGLDLSSDMIRKARRNIRRGEQIELINGVYGEDHLAFEPFDLVFLSYSLTMFGDRAERILEQIYDDLTEEGYIAVVDFHTTPFAWFQRWMRMNHVELGGHLPKLLDKYFASILYRERKAYQGLWSYIHFLGRRK